MSQQVTHQQVGAMGAALPLVLACVSTAQQLNMDGVLASALLALSALHLRRGLPEKAHRLVLRSCVRIIYVCRNIYLYMCMYT